MGYKNQTTEQTGTPAAGRAHGRAANRLPRRQQRTPRTLMGHRVRRTLAPPRHRPAADVPAPTAASALAASASAIATGQAEQRQAELEQELQLARDIQQGILLAAVPHLRGWELSTVSAPARDLGGDLYDFLALPNGVQGIMIGDVSGKGLPAALRMAVARTVFRHEARRGEAPARTLEAINRIICSDIPQGMITMIYLLLDPERGSLRIANAGHTYPFLLNGQVHELELSGLPLGVFDESDYAELDVRIEPGNSILLYTDGVTETTNAADVMFGAERLPALLNDYNHLKPRALQRLLLRELRSWSPHTTQDDDVTMVVLRRRFTALHDELRSIADDVLGTERALAFWEAQASEHPLLNQHDATATHWADVLPTLAQAARAVFGRGLARELQQQFRLAIEEYR